MAEKTILMPRDVIAIKTGKDIDFQPPQGHQHEHLIQIIMREENWVLCAESVDEML